MKSFFSRWAAVRYIASALIAFWACVSLFTEGMNRDAKILLLIAVIGIAVTFLFSLVWEPADSEI